MFMKERTKRYLGRTALTLASISTGGLAYVWYKRRRLKTAPQPPQWARPGMTVTFRAELMPGRATEERTYRIDTLLSRERVRLEGFSGEYTRDEFEPLHHEARSLT